jgi:hypothetical protein
MVLLILLVITLGAAACVAALHMIDDDLTKPKIPMPTLVFLLGWKVVVVIVLIGITILYLKFIFLLGSTL